MTYDAVMLALPRLSTKQLREIKAVCEIRIRNSDRDASGSFELLVLNAIVEALRSSIIYTSVDLCRNSSAYPSFRDKMPGLEEFFARSRLNRITLMWLLSYSVRHMLADMRQWGPVIDHAFAMANIHKLPAYVNRLFPGYAKAGVLAKICKHGRGRER